MATAPDECLPLLILTFVAPDVPALLHLNKGCPVPARRHAQPASRAIGVVLVCVGAVFAVLSVLADSLGFSGGGEGFGYQQLIVLIISVVVILLGVGILAQPMIDTTRSRQDRFEGDH